MSEKRVRVNLSSGSHVCKKSVATRKSYKTSGGKYRKRSTRSMQLAHEMLNDDPNESGRTRVQTRIILVYNLLKVPCITRNTRDREHMHTALATSAA